MIGSFLLRFDTDGDGEDEGDVESEGSTNNDVISRIETELGFFITITITTTTITTAVSVNLNLMIGVKNTIRFKSPMNKMTSKWVYRLNDTTKVSHECYCNRMHTITMQIINK